MGLADIKARLAHIAGIDNLTVEQHPDGSETYQLGDRGVVVPASNAGIRSRVQTIASALGGVPPQALEKVDEAVAAINQPVAFFSDPITEQVEVHKQITGKTMGVSGLTLGSLKDKVADIKKKGEERLAAGLAKIEAAHTEGLAKVEEFTDDIARQVKSEVDTLLHEMAQDTNGPPA